MICVPKVGQKGFRAFVVARSKWQIDNDILDAFRAPMILFLVSVYTMPRRVRFVSTSREAFEVFPDVAQTNERPCGAAQVRIILMNILLIVISP